jgi:hypothetical protein
MRDGFFFGVPARVAVVLVVAAVLLGGCASMGPGPPTPITDMRQIEGKWRGTITLGFNGPMELYYLTIHPDGGMVAEWSAGTQWGKVTLSGGSASFEISAASSGTITYSAAPRSLSLNSTFGNWSAYVTPLE